jgi:hypothetical protein
MVSQCNPSDGIDDREYLLRALRIHVDEEGSSIFMLDMLDLLLDAVQAIRAPIQSNEDDEQVLAEATAVALADVATLIHSIAEVRLSNR